MEDDEWVYRLPVAAGSSCAVLMYGTFAFRRKEIGKPSMPVSLPGFWWLWMIFFVLGLGFALALLSSLLNGFRAIAGLRFCVKGGG